MLPSSAVERGHTAGLASTAVREPSAVNPATFLQREDSYMRSIIMTIILLLTLGATGIVAQSAKAADNPCIGCQNRCLKLNPADYANCKLKCKGSTICLGKRSKKG